MFNSKASSSFSRNGAPSTHAYDMDMPFDSFVDIMERAARHLAYSPRQRISSDYRSRSGMVLEMSDYGVHQGQGSENAKWHTRLWEDTHIKSEELTGSNTVCLYFRRFSPPLQTFSWAKEDIVDVRNTDKLHLRVNPSSSLVFESSRISTMSESSISTSTSGTTCPPSVQNRIVRMVYIVIRDIDKIDQKDRRDVERTVENTVQAVMMGMRLKQRPNMQFK
jgi:hypothetical protein